MANNAAPRFILLPYEEMKEPLEAYYGLRYGQRSLYLRADKPDFRPDVLAFVQPKQLVDTETHPGCIPVKMGEDGKRVMSRSVEKMLHGIDWRYMRDAEQYLSQRFPVIYRTFRAAMDRDPYLTNERLAMDVLGYADASPYYEHINKATKVIYDYLVWVSERWPDGAGA